MEFLAEKFDIVVIGAGHAGIEAALACARLNKKTLLLTINLDAVGNMPCNPSIGGTAKGHLVRELDALGGQMGITADKCCIQYRMLNKGKGPAVHSLRAQADRRKYQQYMKKVIEKQKNLYLKQAEATDIKLLDKGFNVYTKTGAYYFARAVILACGTYLSSRVIIGESIVESGPDGMFGANFLSNSLRQLDISLRRFKTGTPARIHRRSVDFSQLEEQEGDSEVVPFSFRTKNPPKNRAVCHLTYTTEETKEVILANLSRSPLFSGSIEGVGPRYCPSIEDKIVRFKDKERHQLFIEPMGLDTDELYVQGFSSSMPEDVQHKMLKSVKGLKNAEIMRNAYAIEYDCVDPEELFKTLEFKKIENLYGAGQFNGTSGYEEAAAQGLVAGINAARKLDNLPPLILERSDSYIGTLIDDLVTKGTNEPYRMMTSKSEYRLVLRQDNADARLMHKGYEIGLVPKRVYDAMLKKYKAVDNEIERLKNVIISPTNEVNLALSGKNSSQIKTGIRAYELLKRPEIDYNFIKELEKQQKSLPFDVCEQVEIEIKYGGYIKREQERIEKFKKMEQKMLPLNIDYENMQGLRLEARQKLSKIRPQSLGQASRISGVSPADIMALIIHLEKNKGQGE